MSKPAKRLDFLDEYMLLNDALEEIGASRRTGYRWKTRDGLETVRIAGRDWVKIQTIRSFIEGKLTSNARP